MMMTMRIFFEEVVRKGQFSHKNNTNKQQGIALTDDESKEMNRIYNDVVMIKKAVTTRKA